GRRTTNSQSVICTNREPTSESLLRDCATPAANEMLMVIKNTANTNTLLNKCLNSGRKGVTKADCQTALTMVRSNGTHTMLQAAASVAYNGDQWGNFIPTRYVGGARLLPIVLPNCQGAREAVDIVMIVAAAEAFFPSAQPAAGITALF